MIGRTPPVPPQEVLLATDFDGTLSEIVPEPAQAVILPESEAALRRLAVSLKRVAVVSSRPAADLARLVPIRDIDLIGDSGLAALSMDEQRALERFNAEAPSLVGGFAGVWLEIKPAATSVHFRHSNADSRDLLSRLDPLLVATRLHAEPGRRVIEVVPRARAKGKALAALIERYRPSGVVCMGDDENDRPMFDVAAGLDMFHLTVWVSSAEARPDLCADCDLVLSGPDDAGHFLSSLADWATQHPAQAVRLPES
jgi:trehalose 6-phosphate phosphatase